MAPSKRAFEYAGYWLAQRPGAGTWLVRWYDNATRQTRKASLGTADLEQAKARMIDFVNRRRTLKNEDASLVLLRTVLQGYYNAVACKQASEPATRLAMRYADDFFGPEAKVADLDLDRMDAFCAWLEEKGHKANYRRRLVTPIAAAVNRARKRGQVVNAPFIQLPPEEEVEHPPMALEDVARLVDAAGAGPLLAYMLIAIGTGARPKAILDLTRTQLDHQRGVIRLNPLGRKQTAKRRPEVPFARILREWAAAHPTGDSGHLVHRDGAPFEYRTFHKRFRAAVLAADLPTEGPEAVKPYSLRHFFAVEMRNRFRVGAWQVAGIMGHVGKATRTTENYAAYHPRLDDDEAVAVDSLLREVLSRTRWGRARLAVAARAAGVPVNDTDHRDLGGILASATRPVEEFMTRRRS